MESKRTSPLIVIVGPTASGKSRLALELAQFIRTEADSFKYEEAALRRGLQKQQVSLKMQSHTRTDKQNKLAWSLVPYRNLSGKVGAELICADSRTVYKGMDIGTAKPTKKEQKATRHHLLDIIEPSETFTAAEFKTRAIAAIENIASRHNLPIIVGGTGLYVDGVIFDFAFLSPGGQEDREYLDSLSVEELQQKLKAQNIPLPENHQNKRHLVRKLETNGMVPVKKGLRKNTLILGVDLDREQLEDRVKSRMAGMLAQGLEYEVRELARKYGWEAPGMSAVGYREWRQFFNEKQTLAETLQLLQNHTMQYAKRQSTWFRRNPHIQWIKNDSEAKTLVKEFLRKPVL